MNLEGKQQSLLTFRVGPVLCCAPSLPVRSIISPPKLTQTPGCDQSQPGIFKHGSHIVKVIDLRHKFGIDQEEQTQPGNLIIAIFKEDGFAFWVDKILDVIDFPTEGWGNLPAAIPRGIFSRTLLLNKKINLYSEFEKLATIEDCGYLKHYIQQLKQEDEKSSLQERETGKKIKSLSNNSVSEKEILNSTTEPLNISKTENNEEQIQSLEPVKTTKPSNIKAKTEIEKSYSNKIASTEDKTIDHAVTRSTLSKSTQQSETRHDIKAPTPSIKTRTEISAESHKVDNKPKSVSSLTPMTNKPSTDSSQSSEFQSFNKDSKNDESDSNIGLIIFILILISALGSGIYYILTLNKTTTTSYKEPASEINQPLYTYENERYSYNEPAFSESPKYEPDKEIQATKETLTEQSSLKEIEDEYKQPDVYQTELNNAGSNIADLPSSGIPESTDSNYHAEITQQDDEITITIHEPVPDKAEPEVESGKQLLAAKEVENTNVSEPVIETSTVQSLKKDEISPTRPTKKIINEVIHVVVKGDTLWAIAKKYVNNPFLYPELARLSNIKNPHRIYPGNKVRIRFIKN